MWKEIQRSYDRRKTLGLIHSEMDVEFRALRDLLNENIDKVIVDDPAAFKKVQSFVGQFIPKFKNKIFLYEEAQPLFDLYEIDSRDLPQSGSEKSG